MATFGITPVGVFPPASGDGFPRFLQFQQSGENIGDTSVETVNFVGNAEVTLSSDGSVLTVDATTPPPIPEVFVWTEFAGDYTLTADDAFNGLASTGVSGAQVLVVPDDSVDIAVGASIVVHQGGEAQIVFTAVSGVLLRYRSVFNPASAGLDSMLTLIKRASNEWVLCGDMEIP